MTINDWVAKVTVGVRQGLETEAVKAIAFLLALCTMLYLTIVSRPIPQELSTALGIFIGYYFAGNKSGAPPQVATRRQG